MFSYFVSRVSVVSAVSAKITNEDCEVTTIPLEKQNDEVEFVEILSQKGGQCILQNPWPDTEATVYRNGKAAEGLSGKLLTFSTTAGERVALIPKGKAPTAKTLR